MTIEDIAVVAHETNRAYCERLGDLSGVPWHRAPLALRASVLEGVEGILSGRITSAEASHESWLAVKRRQGWRYGPVKSEAERTHPCFMPFAAMPAIQQLKDSLFVAVVQACRPASAWAGERPF